MHVAEGVLSAPVLAAGAGAAAAGVGVGLRRLDHDRIPRVAVLSAAFYAASLIHVPVGPSSAHLILNGVAGVLLGWTVFPALLIALGLQWMFFGFGGVTVLGVNTFNMAAPAVLCHYLFVRTIRHGSQGAAFAAGVGAGALAVGLGSVMLGLSLLLSGAEFRAVSTMVVLAHVPVMVVEGLVTGSVVVFLRKVRPELLQTPEAPVEQPSTAEEDTG